MFRSSARLLLYFIVFVVSRGSLGQQPEITEHPSNVIVKLGHPATLNCRAQGQPKPEIKWFKDGKLLEINQYETLVVLPSGTLFFLEVQDDPTTNNSHVGTYWCVASNAFGSVQSKTARLEIGYLSGQFRHLPERSYAAVGARHVIHCLPPDGNPKPTVEWKKNYAPLRIGLDLRLSLEPPGNLVISGARTTDTGYYACVASNLAGTVQSDHVRLDVGTDGSTWLPQLPPTSDVSSRQLFATSEPKNENSPSQVPLKSSAGPQDPSQPLFLTGTPLDQAAVKSHPFNAKFEKLEQLTTLPTLLDREDHRKSLLAVSATSTRLPSVSDDANSAHLEASLTSPKPVVTRLKPVVTQPQPVVTHAIPMVTHAKPMATEAIPMVTHAKPMVTHAKPVVTEAKPVVTRPNSVIARPRQEVTTPSTHAFYFTSAPISPVATASAKLERNDKEIVPFLQYRGTTGTRAKSHPLLVPEQPVSNETFPSKPLNPAATKTPLQRVDTAISPLEEQHTLNATSLKSDITTRLPSKIALNASETMPKLVISTKTPPPEIGSEPEVTTSTSFVVLCVVGVILVVATALAFVAVWL